MAGNALVRMHMGIIRHLIMLCVIALALSIIAIVFCIIAIVLCVIAIVSCIITTLTYIRKAPSCILHKVVVVVTATSNDNRAFG